MTLVIAYGNPGRGDDGLGPAFGHRLLTRRLPGLDIIVDFQLKVEHALAVATASRVVFVDACLDGRAPFTLTQVSPSEGDEIGSHTLLPASVLALAKLHFQATPPSFVLAIRGVAFDMLHDGFSPAAEKNLAAAEHHFLGWFAEQNAPHVQTPAV